MTAAVRRVAEAARADGRETLLETEVLEILRGVGIGAPAHRVVAGPEEARGLDLEAFGGRRVVVKVLSRTVVHKSDVGGVAVVDREAAAVADAVAAMAGRLGSGPGADVAGFGVFEYVDHDPGIGGELLVGVRWTAEYGPVVTLGPGGLHAEALVAGLAPGRGAAVLSPTLTAPEGVDAALAGTLVGSVLLAPRGGPPPVDPRELASLLRRLLDFAALHVPDPLLELEVNPLVWTRRGPVALDGYARLSGALPAPDPPRPAGKLGRLLAPRTVALVGVSERLNPGRIILGNLLDAGFPRNRLLVVKPGVTEVAGCRAVPDLASLPAAVDLLVLAVGAGQVPDLVDEVVAGERAESLVMIPGGLGEAPGSEPRARRIRAALDRARAAPGGGPVVNGGNCLGVRSVPGRLDTLFIPRWKLPFPDTPPAPLALLSQSGAFAIARATRWLPLGVHPRYLVTVGNQLDLTLGDYLDHLAEDPEVRVFACGVEGFRPGDGARWLRTAARLTGEGRTVILYRAGRTAAGVRASASHTASIAGDWVVTRELARSAGVVVAETLADFDDLALLACRLDGRRPRGRRVGAVTNAGFEAVAMADALGSLELADLSEPTRARLSALLAGRGLAGIVRVANPLDVTPMLDDEAFAEAARAVLEDPGVDLGVVGCVPLTAALETLEPGPGHAEDVAREAAVGSRLASLWRQVATPWVAVVDAGALYDPLVRVLEREGVPTYRTADRALRLVEAVSAPHLPTK